MSIYQLSYRSKATENSDLLQLDTILTDAVLANEKANISGCLIYHNGYFVQILEGSKNDVTTIYGKISKDIRHYNLNLLWEGAADKRYFEKWNMLYHKPSSEHIKIYLNNLHLLAQFSEKATASLLSFWVEVRKIADSQENAK